MRKPTTTRIFAIWEKKSLNAGYRPTIIRQEMGIGPHGPNAEEMSRRHVNATFVENCHENQRIWRGGYIIRESWTHQSLDEIEEIFVVEKREDKP